MHVLLTSLLALVPTTTTAKPSTPWESPNLGPLIGMGEGDGVMIPTEIWDEALNNPNATGHYPIDGFDISKPYPSSGDEPTPIDGWSLDINITADVPGGDSTLAIPEGKFVAGTYIRLTPPPELVTTLANGSTVLDADNTTWTLCISYLWPILPSGLEHAADDDGSCRSIFGDECVRDLAAKHSNFAGAGECKAPSQTLLPDSCEGKWRGSGTTAVWLEAMDYTRGAQIQLSSNGGHDKGDTTAYDVLGQPVGVYITWGYNSTEEGGNRVFAQPKTTLTCVRADKAVGEDSRAPEVGFVLDDGDDEDGGEGGDGGGDGDGDDDGDSGGDGENAGCQLGASSLLWTSMVVMLGLWLL